MAYWTYQNPHNHSNRKHHDGRQEQQRPCFKKQILYSDALDLAIYSSYKCDTRRLGQLYVGIQRIENLSPVDIHWSTKICLIIDAAE